MSIIVEPFTDDSYSEYNHYTERYVNDKKFHLIQEKVIDSNAYTEFFCGCDDVIHILCDLFDLEYDDKAVCIEIYSTDNGIYEKRLHYIDDVLLYNYTILDKLLEEPYRDKNYERKEFSGILDDIIIASKSFERM